MKLFTNHLKMIVAFFDSLKVFIFCMAYSEQSTSHQNAALM
jgi:hypothetical protein